MSSNKADVAYSTFVKEGDHAKSDYLGLIKKTRGQRYYSF